MDNLVILCVISILVVIASYVLSVSWQDFSRHLTPVKLKLKKTKE